MKLWDQLKPVNAYWWREVPNFGDAISPFLLERFADLRVKWDTISRSRVASIGSILEHIPPLWDGVVLGSGRLFEHSRLHSLKRATVLAVRGPLTARGVHGDFAIGDPGLLADELVGLQDKIYDLGILPHWQDDTGLAEKFRKLVAKRTVIKEINPQDSPLEVIRQIGQCRRIVTSSLHGMIVADAFGLPRRVEICPRMEKDGGNFKFRDYSASIYTPFKEGVMMEPRRSRVEDVKFQIYDAYKALKGVL